MSNSLEYPNKKRTFAYRVVRRSKSQNISALALSLNRYHKSATPPFYSDIQSDTRFLIIRRKDNKKLRIIVRNRVFFVLSSFSVKKKSHSRMKNKVSIYSHNQIFAVPLQAESPWQNSQRLIFLIILYIHF